MVTRIPYIRSILCTFVVLLWGVHVHAQDLNEAYVEYDAAEVDNESMQYLGAYEHYLKAVELYEMRGDDDSALMALSGLRNAMGNMSLYGYNKRADLESTQKAAWDTAKVFFGIERIIRIAGDTVWVRMQGGSLQGVYTGSTGGFLSGPNDSLEERENKVIGFAKVTEVERAFSKVALTFSTGMQSYGVRVEDLISVKVRRSKEQPKDVFSALMSDAISFTNLWDDLPYYSLRSLEQYHYLPSDLVIQAMLKEVHDFGEAIEDMVDYNEMVVTGGRYDGMKLYEASQQVNSFDIELFLHYASNYPFNYMGEDIKFSLGFAAWLRAGTPVMEQETFFELWYDYLKKLPLDSAKLQELGKQYVPYLTAAFGSGEDFNTLIDVRYKHGESNLVEEGTQKMLWMVEGNGNDSLYAHLHLLKGYITSSEKRYPEARMHYTQLINRGIFRDYAYWVRGNIYFEEDRYREAIQDYDSLIPLVNAYWASLAKGNKGAALFRLGDWKLAKPLFRAALEGDSTEATWNLNVGISLLFSNNEDSANYYFKRFLDHAKSRAEFDGMIEAFDFNMEKGWFTDLSQKYKRIMQQKWDEEYHMTVLSEESFNLSQDAIKIKDSPKALQHLDTAIWAEYRKKEVNYYSIRSYCRWKAYTYYKMENYDSSVVYYIKAMKVSEEYIKDPEYTVEDYDDVGNLYSWMDATVNERIYDALEYGLRYKLKMDTFRPRLIYLGISADADIPQHAHSKQDIEQLYGTLSEERNEAFSDHLLYHLHNADKEELQAAFKRIVQQVTDEDAFVLHISAPSYVHGQNKGIILGKDSLDLQSLFANMAYVNSGHTLCIVDAADVDFAEEYMAFQSKLHAEQEQTINLMIMAPSEVRKENERGSEFIQPLLKFLEEGQEINSLDALNHLQKSYTHDGAGLSISSYYSGRPLCLLLTEKAEETVVTPVKMNRAVEVEDIGSGSDSKSEALYSAEAKDYALLFAISEYDHLSDLSNPVNDAHALQKVLVELYGFEVEVVVNPTQLEIRKKISEYQNKTYGPKDQLLIYFAGHGFYDESKGFAYLGCKNSKMDAEEAENNYPSFLQYSYFHSNIGYMKACKNVFMVMDVCFGGTFFDNTNAASYAGLKDEEIPQLIANKRQIPTRLFLTSGGQEYVPDGTPGANSPFSLKLIQALEQRGAGEAGVAKDFVSLEDIVSYMHGLPTKVRYGSFGLHQQNGDFIFEYKADDALESLKQNREQ